MSLIFSFKISKDGIFLVPMLDPIFLCRRKLIGRENLGLLEIRLYIILGEKKMKERGIIEVIMEAMGDHKYLIKPP